MKIGILGTGMVGQTLGKKLVSMGHEVKLGSRSENNEKAVKWATDNGDKASHGTFEEAAKFGEMIFVATLGTATLDAVRSAGHDNFNGKVVIDVTNPLDPSKGMPPKSLFVGMADSLGEQVQQLIPDAHVVKTLNIVNCQQMVDPSYENGEPDMIMCGNNDDAKHKVTELLKEFGWKNITDLGDIEFSRVLEPFVLLWVCYGIKHNTWNHAIQFLRK